METMQHAVVRRSANYQSNVFTIFMDEKGRSKHEPPYSTEKKGRTSIGHTRKINIAACSTRFNINNTYMETTMQQAEIRRSANYQPSVCNHESIHSLDSDYKQYLCWWNNLGLGKKLSFSRDLLAESFMWAAEVFYQPQYAYTRFCVAQLIQFVTTIDDVYDVYGSREEVELFTDVIQRWDINAMGHLPNFMELCFLALFNSVNDLGYNTLKEHGCNIIPFLKKLFGDLCKRYLKESQWYYEGYTPTLAEYLSNAWVTIGVPAILSCAYFSMKHEMMESGLEIVNSYPDVIKWSSIINRLCDDLGTAKDEMARGDVPKSVQCYMHETGVSGEAAREHIKDLIQEAWKKLNKELVCDSPLPRAFVEATMHTARTFHGFYQFGDGFASNRDITTAKFKKLLVEPLPI
ncbi:hypothetical protein H6P81_017428 [Aristolochia fimbriata]|uniref:Terpene synthase metal-binding domain-containing protein n=1 Tax=Aristolochia fimbriata TaxID=158543 RepID=A0AAV7DYK2_ARIFI|nr:hypothetical protein H6P81_017428 [Aristolochia fimbriata]